MEHDKSSGPEEAESRGRTGESGIIIFGGGGGSGRGCLFWLLVSVILSVALTVLANLIFWLF